MKLDKLVLKNFLSYVDETIDLTSVNVAAIVGENGSGKSSLIEAITYCLFGQTRAKSDDELGRGYDNLSKTWKVDKFSVQLEFVINNIGYVITRGRTETSTKLKIEHAYKISEDEGNQDLSGSTVKETQAKIEEILGMDYESFVASVILKQNEYDAFLEMSPTEAKKVLMRVIGIEVFEKKAEVLKKLATEIEIEYETVVSKGKELKQELTESEDVDKQLKKNQEIQEATKKTISEVEVSIEKMTKKHQDLKTKYENQGENLQRLKKIEKETNTLDAQITEVENDLDEELSDAKKTIEEVLDCKDKLEEWIEKTRSDIKDFRKEKDKNTEEVVETREKIKQAEVRVKELQCNKQACLMNKEECNKEWKSKINVEVEQKNQSINLFKATYESALKYQTTVDDQIAKLEERVARLQAAQFALNYYERLKTMKGSRKNLENEKSKLESVEIESMITDEDVTGLEIQIRNRKKYKKELDEQLQETQSFAGELKAKKDRIEAIKERLDELRDRRDFLATRKSVYEILTQAFGKNGIPAIMIENLVPVLEASANKILDKLSDGKISVEFRLEKKLKGGGFSDSFEVFVNDGEGTRSARMFSGGERFRVVFAIHSAFSSYLTRRNKTEIKLLIIDEPSGLDGNGLEKLIEVFGLLRKDLDQVFVISHLKDLVDSFENVLYVEKDGTGSHINQKQLIESLEDEI